MSIRTYLKSRKKTHFIINNIEVFIQTPIVDSQISVEKTIQAATKRIPSHLLRGIKQIHVGAFKTLVSRDLTAAYQKSKIFVTNKQESSQDLLDDIVHEVAHSVEELYSKFLYSDKELENEFLTKRKNTWQSLKRRGIEIDLDSFLKVEYDREFDEILYKSVGYSVLSFATAEIFHSPYAATSLNEYFADGFEAFYMKEDLNRLKSLSPRLYDKIEKLHFQTRSDK